MRILPFFMVVLLSVPAVQAQEWSEEGKMKKESSQPADQAAEETPSQPEPEAEAPAEEPAAEEAGTPAPEETPQAQETAEPAAEPAESVDADGSTVYEVKKGDTLWDIADSFYRNPFNWPTIWHANKADIRNPHWIYPEQRFRIPGIAAAAEMAEAPAAEPAPEEVPSPAPTEAAAPAPVQETAEAPVEETPEVAEAEPAPAKSASDIGAIGSEPTPPAPVALGNDSFVADEDWEGDGYIVQDQEKKILIAQYDVIYLNIGSSSGVHPRMRGSIYRRGDLVKDPATREPMGYIVKRIGAIQVTDQVRQDAATAVIVASREPIQLGDIVQMQK